MPTKGIVFLASAVEIESTVGFEQTIDLTAYGVPTDANWAVLRAVNESIGTHYDFYGKKPGGSVPPINKELGWVDHQWMMIPILNGEIVLYRSDFKVNIYLYGYGYGGTWPDPQPQISPTKVDDLFWDYADLNSVAPGSVACYENEAGGGSTWRGSGDPVDSRGAAEQRWAMFQVVAGNMKLPVDYWKSSNSSIYINSATRYIGETFTPGENYTIRFKRLKLFRTGSPGTVYIEIQGTTGGKPDNTAIASGSIDGDSLATSPRVYEISLGAGAALVSGTQYAVVIKSPGSTDGNRLSWSYHLAGGYAGGTTCYSNDGGGSWGTIDRDCWFETFKLTPGVKVGERWQTPGPYKIDSYLFAYFTALEITVPAGLQQVSLTGTGWIAADVSSWITPGDKGAVLLALPAGTTYYWGVRKTGASETPTGKNVTYGTGIVELTNGQFEFYRDNVATSLYLVGSFPPVLPEVTTDAATELGPIEATPNGTLDGDGGEVCQCGFEWGLDTNYGHFTPTEGKTIGQTFSQVIRGLEPMTTYHFRALATNSAGTGYGADRSFTTSLIVSKAYALAREEM